MDAGDLITTIAETSGNARHVTVAGELDIASSSRLAALLDTMIDDGIELIVLELRDVPFADSSGLRVLVNASNRLDETGGSLVVEGMSPAVEKLLQLTGLIDRYRAG